MVHLAQVVEQDPQTALTVFNNMEAALNQVLPGSDIHDRYLDAQEVGLAILVGRVNQASYNPFDHPKASFQADNHATRPEAWIPLPAESEFLGEKVTELGRFTFMAFAKTENMRVTRKPSSFDPRHIAFTPGRVGFAGGRRAFGAFFTPSGLWEMHDHVVSRAFAKEVAEVAVGLRAISTTDDQAAFFEKEFDTVKRLQNGVQASRLSHKDVGKLLFLFDKLPQNR